MSYGGPDPKVEIQLHDFAIAMVKLDGIHEELCYMYLRSQYKVIGDALEDLRDIRWLLS
jgi:hypothetical protein